MGKKALCLIFAFLLSINSFAAVVSDNDGSAFITKAEYDSLKNNFQSQLDQYNSGIDYKIDDAIASYLSGIKLQKTEDIDDLMKGNSIKFIKTIPLVATTIPNAITINYNLSVMHLEEVNKYASSHYGTFNIGNKTGKYNVYELIGGNRYFLGNAQNVSSYSVYDYGGPFVRRDLAIAQNPHKIPINTDTYYVNGIQDDVRSTYGCNGTLVKNYGSAEVVRSLFNTKLSSGQVEYVTFSRTDKMDRGTLTNNYSNYQYKEDADNTSYEMIDWSNFTYDTTNTTYTVSGETADAAPNSYTGGVIPHIRFTGTYITFKPKATSYTMRDFWNYDIINVSQRNIPLYGGVPLCHVKDEGKLKIKLVLHSDEPTTDEIYFFISDSIFSDSVPYQPLKYTYTLPEVLIDGKPKQGTINPGEYLWTSNNVKIEIEMECEKNKSYYYKLDSNSDTSSVWAEISEIKLDKE